MVLTRVGLPKELSNHKINNGPFKTLGVWFSADLNESSKLIYDERLNKIKKSCKFGAKETYPGKDAS